MSTSSAANFWNSDWSLTYPLSSSNLPIHITNREHLKAKFLESLGIIVFVEEEVSKCLSGGQGIVRLLHEDHGLVGEGSFELVAWISLHFLSILGKANLHPQALKVCEYHIEDSKADIGRPFHLCQYPRVYLLAPLSHLLDQLSPVVLKVYGFKDTIVYQLDRLLEVADRMRLLLLYAIMRWFFLLLLIILLNFLF